MALGFNHNLLVELLQKFNIFAGLVKAEFLDQLAGVNVDKRHRDAVIRKLV